MTPNWAAKFLGVGLFFAIVALLFCTLALSRAGCPACLPEFASNGVKLDVLTLELPANGNELRRVLYLGRPFSNAVRDVYAKQMSVDDVFVWLYPAQFVFACFCFVRLTQVKWTRLLLLAASLVMIWAGWLDHGEKQHHLRHIERLRLALQSTGSRRGPCVDGEVGVLRLSSILGGGGLTLGIGDAASLRLNGRATGILCAALFSTFLLVILGWTLGNREIIRWSAVAYSIFPLGLLWGSI